MSSTKCCLCGRRIEGFGNNPWPVSETGRCCNTCNVKTVITARLELLAKEDPGLVRCKTGRSRSGVCWNHLCAELHEVQCCADCQDRPLCDNSCSWLYE